MGPFLLGPAPPAVIHQGYPGLTSPVVALSFTQSMLTLIFFFSIMCQSFIFAHLYQSIKHVFPSLAIPVCISFRHTNSSRPNIFSCADDLKSVLCKRTQLGCGSMGVHECCQTIHQFLVGASISLPGVVPVITFVQ